ncbi:MAG: aminotransferase class I/II-fold pyridoxal phosphate-dependent enzyme [Myxococcales bacterium]|nr:aminotransferase class I/II-fold pyridoxal phosphate-dependent enzyme [Myxococcales bacterium]MCB9708761.1 aminotransferase class I/II-fold pyridoxal phosphate-dependent enzyme [Myxococcales bacterium]
MSSHKSTRGLPTLAVHGSVPTRHPYNALTAPVALTSTYSFKDTAELVAYMEGRLEREEYGRYGNPTVRVLEDQVAALEGASAALAFSSGMAAMTSILFALCRQGAHVVLFADCYRRSRQFVIDFLGRFGVRHTLLGSSDLGSLKDAIQPETVAVIGEIPTNPYLSVLDLERLVDICKTARVRTVIDSTFATPINLRPLAYGVDLVVHSASKYLAGHNDVLAGVLAGHPGLISLAKDVRDVLGAVCDPHAAFLVHRGLKTLSVRVSQHNQAAHAIAEMLESHRHIEQVWYPGLPSHPHHTVAARLMQGYGGVIAFTHKGDGPATSAFIDRLSIPQIAPSFGGPESLIEQPALMSYFDQTPEQRAALGIPDNLVRFSVGLEATQDLLDDLSHALDHKGRI